MTPLWSRLLAVLDDASSAALVTVVAAEGSTPREAGARMIVRPDGAFLGTIGGGALEWELIAEARALLAAAEPARLRIRPLGPELGQCCGGRVTTLVEVFGPEHRAHVAALATAEERGFSTEAVMPPTGPRLMRVVCTLPPGHDVEKAPAVLLPDRLVETFRDARTPLALFGAGHVGRALVLALAPLPFRIRWIDPRDDAFPALLPESATPVLASDPAAEIAAVPPGGFVLVMTHSHPLDLDLSVAALRREDLAFVGLIGSATKRARFEKRMRDLGLTAAALRRLVCPIGVAGVEGKEPAVIAAGVAAQLLAERGRIGKGRGTA